MNSNTNYSTKENNEKLQKKKTTYNKLSNYLTVKVKDNGEETVIFKHIPLAKEVIEEIPMIFNKRGQFYYDEKAGVWRDDARDPIEKIIQDKLDEYAKNSRILETYQYLFRSINKSNSKFPFENNPFLINFKNGIYNIETDEFNEHHPSYHQMIQIPHNYDEDAKCPKIDKFLGDLFDEPEKQFILEWIGYCFVKSYSVFQAILLLQGAGGNGKSTLITLITSLFGQENVSNVTLYDLENNRFAKSDLFMKCINTVADIGDDFYKSTAMIKSISGNDSVMADVKHKTPFHFVNHAKLMYSCNKLPIFRDTSEGFEDRPIILPMDRRFRVRANDEDKEIKIRSVVDDIATSEELSGLALKSLQAFRSVLKKGKFSITPKMQEAKDKWLEEMNHVVQFVKENCVVHENTRIIKDDLFYHFNRWCSENNYKSMGRNKFNEQLIKQYPSLKDAQIVDHTGKRRRSWKGIGLSNE